MEFSDGHSVVEDDAGADQWKYRGAKTGRGYAALVVSPGADSDGGGRAAGRSESGQRRRPGSGSAFVTKQGCPGDQLYGLNDSGENSRAGLRDGPQALPTGGGREENT